MTAPRAIPPPLELGPPLRGGLSSPYQKSEKKTLYRQKDWNRVARLKEKRKKKHEWSTRGGYIGPISVPPTPNSELAKSLKAIADSEAEAGVHFRITETGGISVKSILQSSNPMETAGCDI